MRKGTGFTLIELIIVIVLIGIIASIGITYLTGVKERARDSRRKSDLSQIASALEIYRANNDSYPTSSGGLIVGCGTSAVPTACTWDGETSWTQQNTSGNTITYMKTLSQDPRYSARSYAYVWDTGNNTYYLCANLEYSRDPDIDASWGSSARCNGSFNYGREAP